MFRWDWMGAVPARDVLPAAFGAADFPVCGLSKLGRAEMRKQARIKAIVRQRRRVLVSFRFMSLLGLFPVNGVNGIEVICSMVANNHYTTRALRATLLSRLRRSQKSGDRSQ